MHHAAMASRVSASAQYISALAIRRKFTLVALILILQSGTPARWSSGREAAAMDEQPCYSVHQLDFKLQERHDQCSFSTQR
jgi:hypothetical protein